MNNTIQETYYNMIKVLYGDAISFTPDDVNINVIQIVDTMLDQITKCHQRIKPIALIFEAYADLFQKGYDYKNLFDAFYGFYKVYLEYNSKDRRMAMCINTTKLYWRSPLQLALMGY